MSQEEPPYSIEKFVILPFEAGPTDDPGFQGDLQRLWDFDEMIWGPDSGEQKVEAAKHAHHMEGRILTEPAWVYSSDSPEESTGYGSEVQRAAYWYHQAMREFGRGHVREAYQNMHNANQELPEEGYPLARLYVDTFGGMIAATYKRYISALKYAQSLLLHHREALPSESSEGGSFGSFFPVPGFEQPGGANDDEPGDKPPAPDQPPGPPIA